MKLFFGDRGSMVDVVRQARSNVDVYHSQAICHWHLPSLGSHMHEQGACKPCVFFMYGVCEYGLKCDHCHVPHEELLWKRQRPPKAVREKLKARGAQLARACRTSCRPRHVTL